jgi:hypothetical protein
MFTPASRPDRIHTTSPAGSVSFLAHHGVGAPGKRRAGENPRALARPDLAGRERAGGDGFDTRRERGCSAVAPRTSSARAA